jgi:uncharacterized membrane protein YphA (DoxX/SURF4 family)
MTGFQARTAAGGPREPARGAGAAAQWPRATLRIGFGLIWLIDATMKWLPGFRGTYRDILGGFAEGQPGWLQPWFRFWFDLQSPNLTFFVALVAVLETLIAAAVIAGFARKTTYALGLVFSVLVWGVAEGFGGPYGFGSTDIGGAIMYAVVFASLLGFDYSLGPDPISLDSYLERRITWWHWVAETGHHPGPPPEGTSGREGARLPAGDASRT